MPPDTDKPNPYARPSAWPSMPQQPMHIGPVPKGDAPPPSPRPLAQPRPTAPASSGRNGILSGSAVPAGPSAWAGAAPVRSPPTPQPRAAAPDPQPLADIPPPPETEPARNLFVSPPVRTAKVRRPSRLPVLAGVAVLVLGLAGAGAYVLSRQPKSEPLPPPHNPIAPAAVVAPAAPAVAATEPPAPAPQASDTPVLRGRAAPRPIQAAGVTPRAQPVEPAPLAVQAPVLEAPPLVAPPPRAAAPAPTPAAAPPADPNAPISTRPPFSE